MGARITKSEFLKRARERFGDHFDYSEINYRSYKSPIKIRCNHHAEHDDEHRNEVAVHEIFNRQP